MVGKLTGERRIPSARAGTVGGVAERGGDELGGAPLLLLGSFRRRRSRGAPREDGGGLVPRRSWRRGRAGLGFWGDQGQNRTEGKRGWRR
jgi:hypothetical protein